MASVFGEPCTASQPEIFSGSGHQAPLMVPLFPRHQQSIVCFSLASVAIHILFLYDLCVRSQNRCLLSSSTVESHTQIQMTLIHAVQYFNTRQWGSCIESNLQGWRPFSVVRSAAYVFRNSVATMFSVHRILQCCIEEGARLAIKVYEVSRGPAGSPILQYTY